MQPMPITPDDQRFLLYFLSAFRKSMDTPEQEEADSLVDRIQKHRIGVEMTTQNTPGLDAEREAAQIELAEKGWRGWTEVFDFAWTAALRSQLATTAQTEPVAQVVVSDDDLDMGFSEAFIRGDFRLPNGTHNLYISSQPASAPVVGGDAAEVTEEMISAYFYAITGYWEVTDSLPDRKDHNKGREGLNPHEAARVGLKAALAASKAKPADAEFQKLHADLHLYEEIAEHYAKCAISPEALRDWVAERMDKPADAPVGAVPGAVDSSVTPEYLAWLSTPEVRQRNGIGGNEAWNAALSWQKSACPTPAPALSGVTDAEVAEFLNAIGMPQFKKMGAMVQRALETFAASRALPGGLSAELGTITDTQRLNFVGMNRVALIPEFEGPWDAQTYPDDASEPTVTASHDDVRGVIDAAIAATQSGVKGGV